MCYEFRLQPGKETAMKRIRAYLFFFLVIVLLSSLGVAAERAIRSNKVELTGSGGIPAVNTAASGEAVFQPGGGSGQRVITHN
jgi:hypothetical protein